ncbi:MAG: FadR/GntR family transcriptional regulator, partial [Novosphingobium sp.]
DVEKKLLEESERAAKDVFVESVRQVSRSGAAMAMHDQIAISVGIEIVTGILPEGSALPTEAEAVELHGVSRTVYREAIRSLVGKGLVSSRKKAGTRVNPRREWSLLDPDVLSWMFSAKPTIEAVQSLFELRIIVEPSAAALAALRRTDEQVSLMRDALDDMERHGLRKAEGREADSKFHSVILEATGNDFLRALTKPISTAIRWTTLLKFSSGRQPRDPMMLHRDLFAAIADGNSVQAYEVSMQLLKQAREDTEVTIA